MECISHDSAGPRVVEDAVCAAYAAAPPSLQTCNMHRCPEYRVAAWSAVSYEIDPSCRFIPFLLHCEDLSDMFCNVSCVCSARSPVVQVNRPEKSPVSIQEERK